MRNSVKEWDVDSGQLKNTFEGMFVCQFSSDGLTMAVGSPPDGNEAAECVILVDPESGFVRLRLAESEAGGILCASWSPDGSKIASGGHDETCRVLDSSTGQLLNTFQLEHSCCSLSWGRDWVQDSQRAAFAMGHHPRLGGGSQVLDLEVGVVKMILDRV